MLKLTDFFQPLNFLNLVYYVGALVYFDIFGSFIKSFIIKNREVTTETRLTNWLIGIGFFVFIWFSLGFFVIPTKSNLLISIIITFLISLPKYLSKREYITLFKIVKPLLLPIFLIIPFLPSTFVKASLPPYVWDEMAYHFLSPYDALHMSVRHFTGGLYENVPRLMDILYMFGIPLTNTYSVIRLIQFSIVTTSLFVGFLLIKKLLGVVPAILFILIFLSLPLGLPDLATIGYVDVVAMSFLLLGFLFGLVFLFFDNSDYLVLSALFWGMSLGTKYTTLVSFLAFLVTFLIAYWFKHKSYKYVFEKGILIKIIIVFLLFGGYWYVKNLIIYGNPIYPFIFPCWGRYALDCAKGSSFFGTWTIPVTIKNLYSIIMSLIPQNIVLQFTLIFSSLLTIFYGLKKNKLLLLMSLLPLVIELIIMKYFSGFDARYQQYLIVYLIFVIVLVFSVKPKINFIKLIQLLFFITLISSTSFYYVKNVMQLNSLKYLNWHEINYALGRENINDWIKFRLPDVSEATIYCGENSGEPLNLVILDPDMIWFTYNGLNRVFMVGCYAYYPPNMSLNDWENLIKIAKERKLQFWTISINPCVSQDKIIPGMEGDTTGDKFRMRLVNNLIVCNSTQIVRNLYKFDYRTLN